MAHDHLSFQRFEGVTKIAEVRVGKGEAPAAEEFVISAVHTEKFDFVVDLTLGAKVCKVFLGRVEHE